LSWFIQVRDASNKPEFSSASHRCLKLKNWYEATLPSHTQPQHPRVFCWNYFIFKVSNCQKKVRVGGENVPTTSRTNWRRRQTKRPLYSWSHKFAASLRSIDMSHGVYMHEIYSEVISNKKSYKWPYKEYPNTVTRSLADIIRLGWQRISVINYTCRHFLALSAHKHDWLFPCHQK